MVGCPQESAGEEATGERKSGQQDIVGKSARLMMRGGGEGQADGCWCLMYSSLVSSSLLADSEINGFLVQYLQ